MLETISKLSTQIKLANNGIMSQKEFEAQWGFDVPEAIKLLLDWKRDTERLQAELMSEEEFATKWIKSK